MDLDYTHRYAAAPSSVVELMRDEEFIADVARNAGALEHQVSVSSAATRLEMKLPVPANLSKFVGQTVSLTQIFRFQQPEADGSVRGVVEVEVPGMPITVNAEALLSPEDGVTRGRYTGELAVRIPLVGKKVELLIEPVVRDAFAGLERRAAVWLER